jgi:hypothetical protein
MHNKILTANNLIKRGWSNEPDCRLCENNLETPSHLCKDCPFAQQTWEYIRQWFGLAVLDSVNSTGSLHKYWWKCRRKFEKRQRRRVDGILIYFWWNLWKEMNRRTFQQKSLTPRQVAILCKEEIDQYTMAMVPRQVSEELQ